MKKFYNFRDVFNFFFNEIYVREKIDFIKLVFFELVKKYMWINIMGGSSEVMVFFFMFLSIFYEVWCEVEVYEDDEVWEYINVVYDVFYRLKKLRDWSKMFVYFFKIKEIYDNGEKVMGVRIYL